MPHKFVEIGDIVLYRVERGKMYQEDVNCPSGVLPAIVVSVHEDDNLLDLKIFCNATFDLWKQNVVFSHTNIQGTWYLK